MPDNINRQAAPVPNQFGEGYGTGPLTPLNPSQLQTTDQALQVAQLNYEQVLANNNGDLNAPAVQQALGLISAITTGSVDSALEQAGVATSKLLNVGAAVGAGVSQFANLLGARQQETLAQQRRSVNNTDWRVRLSLAPNSDYLYNDPSLAQEDVMFPLTTTNGVIFPYTPSVQIAYNANYNNVSLTHSNYLNYFYQNSQVGAITLTGTFTAQDTDEANYLLAVIHFFRSATKMFYGQDALAGAPPPLLYLSGFGELQFNRHPVLLQSFNYALPNDVDYIRANSVNVNGASLLSRRAKTSGPSTQLGSAIDRLKTLGSLLGVTKGALPNQDRISIPNPGELGGDRPTYVPTRMEITLTLLPVLSRSQVSKEFSLKGFANGDLLRGGFW